MPHRTGLGAGDWGSAGGAFGRFDRDGGFSGGVAALPGRYSHGETINELKDNIREAIAGVLEVMLSLEMWRQIEKNGWSLISA
jgi:hypothetical protein